MRGIAHLHILMRVKLPALVTAPISARNVGKGNSDMHAATRAPVVPVRFCRHLDGLGYTVLERRAEES
jgi:hypothetical protein